MKNRKQSVMKIGYDFEPLILIHKNMNLIFINMRYLEFTRFNPKFHRFV